MLGVGGISANILRFAIKPRWKTNLILLGGKVHKYFGYFMVFGTQFVLFTGFFKYQDYLGVKGDL
jgi:hypothetical protein